MPKKEGNTHKNVPELDGHDAASIRKDVSGYPNVGILWSLMQPGLAKHFVQLLFCKPHAMSLSSTGADLSTCFGVC